MMEVRVVQAFNAALARFPQPRETSTTMMDRLSVELAHAQDFPGPIQALVREAITRAGVPRVPSGFPGDWPGNLNTKQEFERRLLNM